MEDSTSVISTASDEAPLSSTKAVLMSRYAKPLMVYGFTIFSNAALSFATFAFLTHHLTEVDYGIINLYNSFILLLMPFIGVGVQFVLNVDYFKMDEVTFRKQFTNALIIPVSACILLTVISLLFHRYIEHVTKVNYFFIGIAAFSCLLIFMNDLLLNLIRNKERYFLFAGFALGKNLVEVSLTILLVVGFGFSWIGRLSSSLISLILGGFVILLLLYKWRLLNGLIDKKLIGTIIIAGLPFIPERLALFTMGYSDRFFIDHFSGTADVGYYGAGAQLAMIVNLSILTLNNTFYPRIFKGLSKYTLDKKEISKVILVYLMISMLITIAVIAFVPFFFRHFIGPSFQPGKVYAINLTIGFFFWSIYNLFIAFLLNIRKHKLIMRISLFGMMLSIASNFITVRNLGALGATYTNILVYFSISIITIYYVNKFYGLRQIFHRSKVQDTTIS